MIDKELIPMQGKRIILTGAASGIGRQTAILLHELGASLLLLDVSSEGLRETNALIGNQAMIQPCDLTEFDQLKPMLAKARDQMGKFHGLVHCAGVPSVVPLRALTNEAYEKVQKINVQAGLNLAKIFSSRQFHEADTMSSIVFISSVYGVVGSACNVAYAISKAAIIGMTKALAIEFAHQKIRVNCVAPGFIKTNMADGVSVMFDAKYADRIEQMHPLGWGEADDIARAIAFLLSDSSKWMTGAVMNVDGGFTAQ